MSRFHVLPRTLCVLTLLAFLLAALLPITSAWTTGSGTCNASAPSVTSQTGRHPITPILGFYLDLPRNYTPSTGYTLRLLNTGRNDAVRGFNGFLFYAQDARGDRYGAFTEDGTTTTTDMFNAVEATPDSSNRYSCNGAPASTLTHANGGPKNFPFSVKWTAPSADVGNLTFHGLVEYSNVLYYTQILTPWTVCGPSTPGSCAAFDPSTLPTGPLPPPTVSNSTPAGLERVDQTACGSFVPLPYAVVPPGYCVSQYAALDNPRGIYVTDHGDLLAVETGSRVWGVSGVSLLRDLNGDGVISPGPEYLRVWNQTGLNHGLYVRDGWMYASSPTTVWRLRFNTSNPAAPLRDSAVVVKNIPPPHHQSRTPLVSHDLRWLYVSVGSGSNVDPDDSRSRVIRYNISGEIPAGGFQWDSYSDPRVQPFAPGLRNEVGLSLDFSGVLWGVMNADDELNRTDLGGYKIHNDNPAERLDRLTEEAFLAHGWYGYPQCWAVDLLPNATRGELYVWRGDGTDWLLSNYTDDWCRQHAIPPTVPLQAHTAPIGLVFYDGKGRYAFPPEMYNQILIAQHGSWDSDTPRGYKVSRVEWMEDANGRVSAAVFDFFAYEGPGAISDRWRHKPVDVRIGVNGELFVSSDNSGAVLVIRHINPSHRPILVPQVAPAGFNHAMVGGPTLASAEFTFDAAPSGASDVNFRWSAGSGAHSGLATFDGNKMIINASAANSGAGTAAPVWVGGNMSIELVFQLTKAVSADVVVPIYEAITLRRDGYFDVCANPSADGQTPQLVLTWGNDDYTQTVTAPVVGVRWTDWIYAVLTVKSFPATSQSQVCVYLPSPSTSSCSLVSGLIPYEPRHSYIGGSMTVNALQWAPLAGSVDTLRLYPYAMTEHEALLQFELSRGGVVTPFVWAHFAMQPMESNEATFAHEGVGSHLHAGAVIRQPPRVPELFPGWAHFDGAKQYIDLTNPANGVGGVWTAALPSDSRALTVELWYRPEAATAFGLLDAHPVVSLYSGDGKDLMVDWTDTGSLTRSVTIPGALQVGNWTHVVWSTNDTATSAWVSGARVLTSTTLKSIAAGARPAHAMLGRMDMLGSGAWFKGSIASFRAYPVALSDSQVAALYAAQMDTVAPPPSPPPPVDSSTGTDSSSGAVPVPSSTGSGDSEAAGFSTTTIGIGILVVLLVIVVSAVAYGAYKRRQGGASAPSTTRSRGQRDDRRTALLSDDEGESNS